MSPFNPEHSSVGPPRFAVVDDRIRDLEQHDADSIFARDFLADMPDRIPAPEKMELKIVYGGFMPHRIQVIPEVATKRILDSLGCWFAAVPHSEYRHYGEHGRWPDDMHVNLSLLVDIEFLSLRRTAGSGYYPFAALLWTTLPFDSRARYSTDLYLRYKWMNAFENVSNCPGHLSILRQENRPRAEISEKAWRNAVRWERPHQCAGKSLGVCSRYLKNFD